MKAKSIVYIFLTVGSSLLALVAKGQEAAAEAVPGTPADESFYFGQPLEVQIALILLGSTLLISFIALFSMIQAGVLFRQVFKDQGKELPWTLRLLGIFSGDTTALTGEYKEDVMEGHEYDGIYELDNDLPPWWKYGFYLTIVVSVVYMLHYHVFKTGDLQLAEYEKEVQEAELLYANVDLDYSEEGPTTEKPALEFGEKVFIENCKSCHGEQGEGNSIGPNLTDKQWIYGGDINTLYQTVKYGRAGKMPEWGHLFSNKEIYHIASYVSSLYGTNPPNAKESEGDIEYVPGEEKKEE